MRFVGIDLHKRSLTVCVIDKTSGETFTRKFSTSDLENLRAFFLEQGEFQAVVEATATYEWLWEFLEPHAQRLVLAHPKKIKVISESVAKTDKKDASFLAWLLSQDMVPEAHRPSPRRRAYQQLVRHRVFLIRRRTQLKNKVTAYFAARNIESRGIFTSANPEALIRKLPPVEQFCVEDLLRLLESFGQSLQRTDEELRKFRKEATVAEKKNHAIVCSVPGVGAVTADVLLSTLGDPKRFPSAKKVGAYSGLIPGLRESDATRKELPITKQGPRLLRWALVEAAWRCIRYSCYWKSQFQRIAQKRGKKKAIVAVARRLLVVIWTLLKKGEEYVPRATANSPHPVPEARPPSKRRAKAPLAIAGVA